ncbi:MULTISPECIES: hypothetical protein [Ralstonia solanacearum species complex]|uniref:hypothetical protein n=1 Tax=Ralstonia solanacearum species complex TaxID=3116862 RepID=UPI001072C2E3|nr:hypothetical protein [Ralstonia solanacearum]
MSEESVVDSAALVGDLRLATAYSSRAGLLRDRALLDSLAAAEKTIQSDPHPDIYTLTIALNAITQAIFPMTLADLRGRDPFSPTNQRTSQHVQLALSIFSLLLLVVIGFFMQALHREQEVLVALSKVQDMHPELKLNALRKMAQYDEPMLKQNTLYDEYHQSLSELRQMNTKLNDTYTDAVEVADIPLFPLGQYLRSERTTSSVGYPTSTPQSTKMSYGETSASANAPIRTQSSSAGSSQAAGSPSSVESTHKMVATPSSALNMPGTSDQTVAAMSEFCAAGRDGNISLPQESMMYPDWMKALLSDTLGDFCFQLKVLSPAGDGALLNNALTQLSFVSDIREKVAVRVAWFLPFFYGLLGSAVFLMRNVANVRTPAMEWFPIVMRISLGGVAGIVIVWFSSATTPGLENVGSLSVPFAAAFLTGYGIDVLFTLLDRLNRAIGEIPKA